MTSATILSGGEKNSYLRALDTSLARLSEDLLHERNSQLQEAVRKFGESKDWDFTRLPPQTATYKHLSRLVSRAREQYDWFADVSSPTDCERNRAYPDGIQVSPETGLPFVFDFIKLGRMKRNAPLTLENHTEYAQYSQNLMTLLLRDDVPLDDVSRKAQEIRRSALERSFFEQIQTAPLIEWKAGGSGVFAAQKIVPMGGEDLWEVTGIKFTPSSGMFEAYVIDVWQDIRAPVIQETPEGTTIHEDFKKVFTFGQDNTAWYILKNIDEEFESLHPVHVSRALIGPYENKYLTKPQIAPLPRTKEILSADPQANFLRFSRRYSYAPNHESQDEKTRQVVEREEWADEFIVAPARWAAKVSESVLGTNVRVIEMEETQ